MKILIITLTIFSTLLTGCDRETLDGLRLGFQANFKSDYEKEESEPTSQTQQTQPNQPEKATQSEKWQNQPVQQVNAERNPDEALPFRPLESCSQGGIVAQTNKIFYKKNPDVKSIDSKNKEQVKNWQEIEAQVKQKCADSQE